MYIRVYNTKWGVPPSSWLAQNYMVDILPYICYTRILYLKTDKKLYKGYVHSFIADKISRELNICVLK